MTATANRLLLKIDALRLGMFVQLDLGWMNHPFPRSRFKLDDPAQIATLRQLGVLEVLVRPDLSDPVAFADSAHDAGHVAAAEPAPSGDTAAAIPTPAAATAAADSSPLRRRMLEPCSQREPLRAGDPTLAMRRAQLGRERDSLARSERLHAQASRAWLGITRDAVNNPTGAHHAALLLADGLVDELLGDDDTTIRVLSEAAGTAASQHALNVTVLSLLLGRSLGLDEATMQTLALGALLHDIGKLLLPDHLRNADASNGALLLRERREHVAQGARLGLAMGLQAAALQVISQHHEQHDGSGLPLGLAGNAIAMPARVVALVDTYDRLCNPMAGQPLRTPHEAQALLFAHMRKQLDPAVLAAFIKLLGVYPPGSVVQLNDERLALVVAVHPQRPLKPSVVVHDPRVPRDEALIVHLQQEPGLGIRRSLHPQHLPRAVVDYLSPRERVSYYFAHGLEPAVTATHGQAA
ncbi:metal dependent phosphohydrolase [Leptothrix cholodnii SP-6]|uniref:Metal dependent phosphohydrolase n=1 Tax=Leptothrix cholodnii (strain ATCC 51168 / LMG 8142 / SP-6) TaxID=395495 RepID=B1XYG4_LEPCP|nr:HD-GYP domain-containing protein [Leptothrix cholodnii]ACB35209.1 metal dependent phosphohydrolase [Leptothrix cholodnii SP-6]